MPGLESKPGGRSLVEDAAGPASAPLAPGKRSLVDALPQISSAAASGGASYDDMLVSVLAAQSVTERAVQGDSAARAQVFALLAPLEARLGQLNDHQGRLAQFGAGNLAGQAALDMAETAIRTWRQRLTLGTIVRTDELVLRFRAGAEPIRFLTGQAKDAPTLRELGRVSGRVATGAAAALASPAIIALAAAEAPLLAFAARTAATRISLWSLANPAAALAASEALLGYGIQLGEGGLAAFWAPLNDPQGRWLFLLQILTDYMHVQTALHPSSPRPGPASGTPEPPPDLAGARQRLANIRQVLRQVDEAATPLPRRNSGPSGTASDPYSSAKLTEPVALEPPGGARKPKAPRPSVGKPAPDNPFAHVQQREPDWCGAACGEMSARRLGVDIDQQELAATSHFKAASQMGSDQGRQRPGGFHTDGLLAAMKELAPIPGRKWIGGNLPQDLSTPSSLLTHLRGYLKATQASIILRVHGADHWIIIDSVTPDDRFMIRDPGERMSTIITPDELSAMRPIGHAVLSFLEKTQ